MYDVWGNKCGNSAKLLWKWGKPACFHTKTSDAVARCNHRDSIISLCCNILPGFLPTCLCWQRHVTSRRGYLSHRVRVATTKGGSILLNYPNHVNTKSSMTKFMKRNFTSHTFQLKYCLRIRKQHTFFSHAHIYGITKVDNTWYPSSNSCMVSSTFSNTRIISRTIGNRKCGRPKYSILFCMESTQRVS